MKILTRGADQKTTRKWVWQFIIAISELTEYIVSSPSSCFHTTPFVTYLCVATIACSSTTILLAGAPDCLAESLGGGHWK